MSNFALFGCLALTLWAIFVVADWVIAAVCLAAIAMASIDRWKANRHA